MGRPRNSEEEKKLHARIRSARYYAAHPEHAQEASKRWRDKNRARVNAVAAAHQKANSDQYRIYCIMRRTRKAEAGGSFTPEEWTGLCILYKRKCLRCRKRKPLTADHVIPLSRGGTSNIDNIQPLCKVCNSIKGAKTTDYRKAQR